MTPPNAAPLLSGYWLKLTSKMAECESLASQPVLSYDEEELFAIQLASCRRGWKHVSGCGGRWMARTIASRSFNLKEYEPADRRG